MIMMATTGWPDRVAMTACGRVAGGRWPRLNGPVAVSWQPLGAAA